MARENLAILVVVAGIMGGSSIAGIILATLSSTGTVSVRNAFILSMVVVAMLAAFPRIVVQLGSVSPRSIAWDDHDRIFAWFQSGWGRIAGWTLAAVASAIIGALIHKALGG